MGKEYEVEVNEFLYMDLDDPADYHLKESISISVTPDGYVSIILSGWIKDQYGKLDSTFYSPVFPNTKEIDLIIKALQKAKQMILEKNKSQEE